MASLSLLSVHMLTHPEFCVSRYPYKWIHFATGVTLGMKGDLSASRIPLDIIAYDQLELPTESVDLYFVTLGDDRSKIFPVDPNVRQASITSQEGSTRCADFRSHVMQRDKSHCVLSGVDEGFCDAVHILAHNKGNAVGSFSITRLWTCIADIDLYS